MTSERRPCSAKKDGKPCKNYALGESDSCFFHGGKKQLREETKGVRSHLARSADQHADVIEAALLEALDVNRETWVTCSHCNHRSKVEIPDANGRARVAQVLVELGHGRMREQEQPEPIDLDSIKPMEVFEMTFEERAALKAAIQRDYPEVEKAWREYQEQVMREASPERNTMLERRPELVRKDD